MLDLNRGVTKSTIHDPSFIEPYRIAVTKRFAYVCNSGSPAVVGQPGTLSIIDTEPDNVVGVITGFDGPGGIVISGSTAYVTNYGAPGGVQYGNGKTVSVVNLEERKVTATIQVDQAPAALKLSPCGCNLYVVRYVDYRSLRGLSFVTWIIVR